MVFLICRNEIANILSIRYNKLEQCTNGYRYVSYIIMLLCFVYLRDLDVTTCPQSINQTCASSKKVSNVLPIIVDRDRNADAGIQLHRPRNGRPSAVRERGPGSGALPN
jgi:hypothetical protein